MPVAAAIVGFTVEYVRPAARSYANCLYGRPVLDQVPPGLVASRINGIRSVTVGGAKSLVVLLAASRLGRLSPCGGHIAIWPDVLPSLGLARLEIVVRPV